jgi:energy-coupling factor transporter ATP-binding protein EcfA2
MSAEQIVLTDDQSAALDKIDAGYGHGRCFLLTGNAGSGKTTLMQSFARRMLDRGLSIAFTAPTHKAVSVLSRKLAEAGIDGVDCRTIHSLLSLKPRPHGDRLVFEREGNAPPVMADIVVVDECSMVNEQIFRHIKRHLPVSFVLFVGDPAQLPPVGEIESQTFSTPNKAHLTSIVRQAADNPIIQTANVIRMSQGGAADWSWCEQNALETGMGVFLPKSAAYGWMHKAFTSDKFDQDPDYFRYLAWTNRRVSEMNELIRSWRYGSDIPTPFMPGERAMFRAPLIREKSVLFSTNEEATVLKIEAATIQCDFPDTDAVSGWTVPTATWKITMLNRSGVTHEVHAPQNDRQFQQILNRLKDEAAESKFRWKHFHDFKSTFAQLQAIYCLTIHNSQGATFSNIFCDVPDIRRREQQNLLETQQLAYVAATRPSHRLILVGV